MTFANTSYIMLNKRLDDDTSQVLPATKDCSYPSLDGSLLLPDLINFHLRHNSSLPCYLYSNDAKASFSPPKTTVITYLEFAHACHRVAHMLRPHRVGNEGQVVGIVASTDTILYHTVVAGMMLAGFIPLPMAPTNSPAAIVNMLRKTGCRRLLTIQRNHESLLTGIRTEIMNSGDQIELDVEEIPYLARVYPCLGAETSEHPFEPYPSCETRPQMDDTLIYIHSSGSTGLPKPIPTSHLTAVQRWSCPIVYDPRVYPIPIRLGTMSLPPFHAMGISLQIFVPLASVRGVVVFPPTSFDDPYSRPIVPTPDNILDAVRSTGANALIASPTFLEAWSTSPEALRTLATQEMVVYGGGLLPTKTGDKLVASGVHIGCLYGGTEFGSLTQFIPRMEDRVDEHWSWQRFSNRAEYRWIPQGDGLYELHVLNTEIHELSIVNLPDVKGYATGDIFIKHPTRENLWKIVGRADDIISLTSGENVIPSLLESIISTNACISGAIVFCNGANKLGVLVEPRPNSDMTSDTDKAKLKASLRPEIEEANQNVSSSCQIDEEMILVTSLDRPMLRTGKGTIMRKATLQMYELRYQ
ncbi:hypothetical protein SERLA73DRAFT_76323 [Serpula lacrymans var. lacrymans S7.3]|uniref:AMP-dependent synthetase/ligase domain-containing protein n=2 Tax=Serpula lacrymans var. lacrymans TaxID=341189 RepID=F8Q6W3_SERL3|nr:uncharacterized protein SERLADRAFT_441116 [Serpula lacrymans var. lacrymans S7.9]EGN96351.1 hypothetical protein SERLA73DRAFT_76323 [Serpula lacrymans var. lacrymans S7.3]EGO21890.1 hypothetical protein SERLADRAFT_441116 [Serpula lacrymans var. lacrymans S7.9]